MKQMGFLPVVLVSSWLVFMTNSLFANNQELPSLGDSTSGIISLQEEYNLGRTYLKNIRNSIPTVDDPQLKDYLERVLSRLTEVSGLQDHRLVTLLIKDSTVNAFAAPGGIIGVNTGLFFNFRKEGQFAAVLAHELAHLSQRHYARRLGEARSQSLSTTATILAAILLTAAGNPDVGIAAFTSTLAGAQMQNLRFSRHFEREADDIGIKILTRAGYDPNDLPEAFDQMSRANRFNSRGLEFLSTHPVTLDRVANGRARAAQIAFQAPERNAEGISYFTDANQG